MATVCGYVSRWTATISDEMCHKIHTLLRGELVSKEVDSARRGPSKCDRRARPRSISCRMEAMVWDGRRQAEFSAVVSFAIP